MTSQNNSAQSQKSTRWLFYLVTFLVSSGAVLSAALWFFDQPPKQAVAQIPNGYHYQGVVVDQTIEYIDFDNLARNHVDFMYTRATTGNSVLDTNYRKIMVGGQQAGLKVGVVHTYDSKVAVDDQLSYVRDNIDEQCGDLPVAVAVKADQLQSKDAKEQLKDFLGKLAEYQHKQPIVQTDTATQKQLAPLLSTTKFWLTDTKQPTFPKQTAISQYDDAHEIGTGMRKIKLPTSVFQGDTKQYQAFMQSH